MIKTFEKRTYTIQNWGGRKEEVTIRPAPLKLPWQWRIIARIVRPLLLRIVTWIEDQLVQLIFQTMGTGLMSQRIEELIREWMDEVRGDIKEL